MKRITSTLSLLAGLGLSCLLLGVTPVEAKVAPKASVKTIKKYRNTASGLYAYIPVMKELSTPVSFCVTAEMKTRHHKTVVQMEKDIEEYGIGHETAVAKYKNDVDMIWAAMEQPYCGYGTFGMKAVKKSYEKSAVHVRTTFLKAVKE